MSVPGIGVNTAFSNMTAAQPKYAQQAVNTVSKPSYNQSSTQSQQKSKTPIVVGSIALAALCAAGGVYAHKQGLFKAGKGVESKAAAEIKEKINSIKTKFQDELDKLLKDTQNCDLKDVDRIAGDYSGDIGRGEDRFHFAATFLEDSYINAYSKAKLENGKNMFNWIANRIEKESDSIPLMYAQMDRKEANVRLSQFAKAISVTDDHTGMTMEGFIKLFNEKFFAKGEKKLAELKK